jgi:hypothetical protein
VWLVANAAQSSFQKETAVTRSLFRLAEKRLGGASGGLLALLATITAGCAQEGPGREDSKRYEIITFHWTFESDEPFWSEIRQKIDEAALKRAAAIKAVKQELGIYLEPPVMARVACLDASGCAERIKELIEVTDEVALGEALAGASPLAGVLEGKRKVDGTDVRFVIAKCSSWARCDAIVIKDAKATRVELVGQVDETKLSYTVDGGPSWSACRSNGLHCDPADPVTAIVDVTGLAVDGVEPAVLTKTYQNPLVTVAFDFSEPVSDLACSITQVTDHMCGDEGIEEIREIATE